MAIVNSGKTNCEPILLSCCPRVRRQSWMNMQVFFYTTWNMKRLVESNFYALSAGRKTGNRWLCLGRLEKMQVYWIVILCLGIIFPLWVYLLLLANPLKSNGCSILLTSIGTAYSAVHRDSYQINHKQSGGKKPSKIDTIVPSRSKELVMDCTHCFLGTAVRIKQKSTGVFILWHLLSALEKIHAIISAHQKVRPHKHMRTSIVYWQAL